MVSTATVGAGGSGGTVVVLVIAGAGGTVVVVVLVQLAAVFDVVSCGHSWFTAFCHTATCSHMLDPHVQ